MADTSKLAPSDAALVAIVDGVRALNDATAAYQQTATERLNAIGKECLSLLQIRCHDALVRNPKADTADVRESTVKEIQGRIQKEGLAVQRVKDGKLTSTPFNVTRAIKLHCVVALVPDAINLGAAHLEKMMRGVKADWKDGGSPAFTSPAWEKSVRKLVPNAIEKAWSVAKLSQEVEKCAASMLDPDAEAERQVRAERLKAERQANARAESIDEASDTELVAYLAGDSARMERFAKLLAMAKQAAKDAA